ncbi:long-chain-fatty-acid--CoA ligase [Motilibacter aurantiacus]|uniref:long-chain-fatty-acid--CoA ligase n=1 Tax=Motilibacter aurantiacus TaxID=2714955 RepID=UPI00140B319C|nr:long-chain-fatty-acid--CoA ligase [Motilibacter aurantiacus]NHC45154.1 AMP-binding protein [Motilibacter aurantiacus]
MADPMIDRPWLRAYASGVPADVEVPEQPLSALLDRAVTGHAASTALDFMGATTTYAQLGRQVAQAAEALRRLGVRPGDRVALALPNCPQHVVAFYAVLRLGAVVVEHNPLYTADELATQLADSGATVAVVWEKTAPVVEQVRSRTSVGQLVTVDLSAALPAAKRLALRLPLARARRTRAQLRGPVPAGSLSWERLVAQAPPLDPATALPSAGDPALLQYTGGTTGIPKGAVLTHRNLAANAEQSAAWVPGLKVGEETFVGVLPIFHAYGLTLCLTAAVRLAACVVLLPRFDVDSFLAAAKRRPPTFLPGVPGIYDRLADAVEERGADLSSIRYAISGAMSLPPATVERWEKLTGGMLVEGYGMTETSPITIGNPISDRRRPGTVGLPFPSTRVRVVDPEDPTVERPVGEAGELLVQGPQVFAGYWQRPEETAATLLPGGWIRTGDIAVMDEDGFVSIVDRIKELIITGGFNVYPSEVEDVLRLHASVHDAAVVGLPDAGGGELVAAAVQPAEGGEIDAEALRAWCRERLAGYKTPRRLVVMADLPRSQVGKVLRRQVRERLSRED